MAVRLGLTCKRFYHFFKLKLPNPVELNLLLCYYFWNDPEDFPEFEGIEDEGSGIEESLNYTMNHRQTMHVDSCDHKQERRLASLLEDWISPNYRYDPQNSVYLNKAVYGSYISSYKQRLLTKKYHDYKFALRTVVDTDETVGPNLPKPRNISHLWDKKAIFIIKNDIGSPRFDDVEDWISYWQYFKIFRAHKRRFHKHAEDYPLNKLMDMFSEWWRLVGL
jgi:hypothetical protein